MLALVLQSCIYWGVDDDVILPPTQQQYNYQAVTMLRSDFENSTELLESKPITNTGKIYVKDNYLFINEPNKGFHVFDNSNPENPVNLVFLKVLGSTDLSIKGEMLYINNSTDLIAVKPNFSESTIEITKRVQNAFPELASPDFSYHNTPENEVIINWILNE